MAQRFLEVENIYHNYQEFSRTNMIEMLAKERKNPDEPSKEEGLYDDYGDEFAVLYRIKSRAAVDEDNGEGLKMEFKTADYIKPEIESDKKDTVTPEKQLELECTFEDGTSFGLRAIEALPKTADIKEPKLMKGQIHISEETLKNLNDEKFKRIVEFCDKYGFSSFSLNVPMYGGEIDVDETLAKLFEKYQQNKAAELESKNARVADENAEDASKVADENENAEDAQKDVLDEDFHAIADNVASIDCEEPDRLPLKEKRLGLNNVRDLMRDYIENDLQKREGLSYWEHQRKIDGRWTYVYSLYDKESADNYKKDGIKDKNGRYVSTASCRLLISQDEKGMFRFGYCTPNGAKMNDTIASDFVGVIKKTGVTHLNFSNIPEDDRMVWLIACSEKGVIPEGISLAKSKVKTMLSKAEDKLSTEEYATFVERLMDQWEEDTAKKGKTLSISDQEYIKSCRNMAVQKRENQYDLLKKAEFEKKFKNFRDSYNTADGLLAKVNNLVMEGGVDTRTGAATTIAAMNTLSRTYDIVLGLEIDKTHALDVSLGARLDELMKNPMKDKKGNAIAPRITEEEKHALASISGKLIKDLNKADYMMIYDLLYTRQVKQTERAIIGIIKDNLKSGTKVAGHLLTDQLLWRAADTGVKQINEPLRRMETTVLTLPDKHSGLHVSEFREIAEKEVAEEKAREEAAKVMPVKTSVERGR